MKQYIALIAFFLLSWPLLAAKISYRVVETSGEGTNPSEAITTALVEAIGMVNGRSIESQTSLQQMETSLISNDKEDYISSEAFKSAVKSATKGTVSEYEVLSTEKNDGLFFVKIRASVAKLELSRSAFRKRIAVFPLRTGDQSFRIGNGIADKERISRLLGQGIASNLVQSRKFTVLDREYISEQLAEKANILFGDVKNEEMAKMGQELVADMILVGTIEDFGVQTKTVRMQLSGRSVTTQNAFVNFGYRIMDIATKQIKFADVLELKLDPSELQAVASGGSQGELESAICSLASEKISIKILEAIYPIVVVSARGKYITLGQGGNNLQKGDKMEIFQYGDTITDPYTGESLGREEIPIGIIQITRVNAKTTSANYIEGDYDISANFEPNMFLCRSIESVDKSNIDENMKESRSNYLQRKEKRNSLFD